MIKATGTVSGPDGTRPVLFMILLPENTRRLQAGDPIVFEAADVKLPPMRLVITYARNPDEARAALAPMMRPDARQSPEPLEPDQVVDWASVADRLAIALGGHDPGSPALAAYAAAREREGL